MKKILLVLFVMLIASSSFSQTIKISTMLRFLDTSKDLITDDLISKGFTFSGKKEEKYDDSYVDLFYWTNPKKPKEDITKVFQYNLNELNERGLIKTIAIRYRTASSANYLLIKKELLAAGYKFVVEGDNKGELLSVYSNKKYDFSIWVSPSGEYDISVKKI